VLILSFSREPINVDYGELTVGPLAISVDSSGIAKANLDYYTWPGKPGSITVNDGNVFGYFLATAPDNYFAVLEVEKGLVFVDFLLGTHTYRDFNLPSRWKEQIFSYLVPLKANRAWVQKLEFDLLSLDHIRVRGEVATWKFRLHIAPPYGGYFSWGDKIAAITPEMLSWFLDYENE